MDANRTHKIDLLILDATRACDDPEMNLEITSPDFGQSEVDDRLMELARMGHITVIESVGQTTVTSITNSGLVYLQSLGG
jgi:hypothetical protein